MQHLGAPIQKQILTSLEKRTEAALEINDGRRSMAAMAIAAYCLERFGDRKPEEALEWILLAASLGNMQAKSDVYSISKALGLFSRDEERILSFLIEGARDGNPVAIKNLMVDYPEKGKEVLRELKKMRRDGC
jgi:hypothetical protein